jgi:hypothetical protein
LCTLVKNTPNQAKLVIDALEVFDIEQKLGFFVVDNDGKNNTLCETLTIWMKDRLGIKWILNSIGFDAMSTS